MRKSEFAREEDSGFAGSTLWRRGKELVSVGSFASVRDQGCCQLSPLFLVERVEAGPADGLLQILRELIVWNRRMLGYAFVALLTVPNNVPEDALLGEFGVEACHVSDCATGLISGCRLCLSVIQLVFLHVPVWSGHLRRSLCNRFPLAFFGRRFPRLSFFLSKTPVVRSM